MKLYYFDHCPFCTRAKMMSGYKRVTVEYIILLNDDATTCNRLIGKKQVPILEFDDGSAIGESLDIAHKFDEIGDKTREVLPPTDCQKVLINHISSASEAINNLCFPRNVKASLPEFATASAIAYFQTKKEKIIGKSFEQAMDETGKYKTIVENMLKTLPPLPAKTAGKISWDDVMVFPFLRNLTIVKDLALPDVIKDYLTYIVDLTGINLYYDRAL